MSTENNGDGNKLTNHDLWKVLLYQLTIRDTNNYERQQDAGLTEAMMPVIEKYYEGPEGKKEAYARHMEYFLTNGITSAIPMGVTATMEDRYATEDDTDPDSIDTVKTALIRPLARPGDSLLNGTTRPILTGITISLITAGLSWIGPIFFVIDISVMSPGVRHLGVFQGYEQSVKFVEETQSSRLISRVSELVAIMAYVIVGRFIPAPVVISIPIVCQGGDTVLSIQETFDGLMPGILGMLYIGLMYLLIPKKKVSTAELIPVIMTVDVVGIHYSTLG